MNRRDALSQYGKALTGKSEWSEWTLTPIRKRRPVVGTYYSLSLMYDVDTPEEAIAKLRQIAEEIAGGKYEGRGWDLAKMENES